MKEITWARNYVYEKHRKAFMRQMSYERGHTGKKSNAYKQHGKILSDRVTFKYMNQFTLGTNAMHINNVEKYSANR